MAAALEAAYRLTGGDVLRLERELYAWGRRPWVLGISLVCAVLFCLGLALGETASFLLLPCWLGGEFALHLSGYWNLRASLRTDVLATGGTLTFREGTVVFRTAQGEAQMPLSKAAGICGDAGPLPDNSGAPTLRYRRVRSGIVFFQKTAFRPLFYVKPSDFAQADGLERLEAHLRQNGVEAC